MPRESWCLQVEVIELERSGTSHDKPRYLVWMYYAPFYENGAELLGSWKGKRVVHFPKTRTDRSDPYKKAMLFLRSKNVDPDNEAHVLYQTSGLS